MNPQAHTIKRKTPIYTQRMHFNVRSVASVNCAANAGSFYPRMLRNCAAVHFTAPSSVFDASNAKGMTQRKAVEKRVVTVLLSTCTKIDSQKVGATRICAYNSHSTGTLIILTLLHFIFLVNTEDRPAKRVWT